MAFASEEILQTIRMVAVEKLDIRTATIGLSLLDCARADASETAYLMRAKLRRHCGDLVPLANAVAAEFGIPIVNKRVAVTPLALVGAACDPADFPLLASALDASAKELGVDFIGGYAALMARGATSADKALLHALPHVLSSTERVCAALELASTRSGINMDGILTAAGAILEAARLSAEHDSLACAKLVIFANAVGDNPFMAGAFHGVDGPEVCLHTGISGPGVIARAVRAHPEADLSALSEEIKRQAFRITRAGEALGRTLAARLSIPFGSVDLSLAPAPTPGDSVGEILEAMGLSRTGVPGSTAALALLTDAVKRGGAMASSHVGGLSGAFIPVSEDTALMAAAAEGFLGLEKLEAMTAICSVGLDMIAIPGDTSVETLAAIIADELAIGMVNNKTVGVRLIPVHGKSAGEWAHFGGLLGRTPILSVRGGDSTAFVRRGGHIPGPLQSLRN